MSRANKSSYKWLKARGQAKKAKKREFDQRFNSVLNKLFPRTSPTQNQDSKNYDQLIKNLEDNYNQKLAQANKQNQAQLNNQQKRTSAMADSFNQQLEAQNAKYTQLSEGVQKAFDNIMAKKKAETSPEQAKQAETPASSQISDSQGLQDFDLQGLIDPIKSTTSEEKTEESATSEAPAKENAETKSDSVTDTVIKNTLAIGDSVSLGKYSYKATNLYGLREGKNAVAGRKVGSHSKGVDVVTHDSEGKKVNLPVSISDGVISSIRLQGSGKAISTVQGSQAGYMIDVVQPNGKMITYAHVSPKVADRASELVGRKVRRGDLLFDQPGFSGSGTAPHIKIFVSDTDKKGVSKRNYTEEGNDPTNLILTGKHL